MPAQRAPASFGRSCLHGNDQGSLVESAPDRGRVAGDRKKMQIGRERRTIIYAVFHSQKLLA